MNGLKGCELLIPFYLMVSQFISFDSFSLAKESGEGME
jgi:hypothetical protein